MSGELCVNPGELLGNTAVLDALAEALVIVFQTTSRTSRDW